MTTTLSADDVRRLVMTDCWCPKCGVVTSNAPPFDGGTCQCQPDYEDVIADPNAGALLVSEDYPRSAVVGSRRIVRCHRPALFTRCPGCQPEGLEWSDRDRFILVEDDDIFVVARLSWVIDLILMSIARDATAAYDKPSIRPYYPDLYITLTTSIMSTDLPGAVAARHRLKDLEDST